MKKLQNNELQYEKLQNEELQLIIAIISSKNYCKLICPYPCRAVELHRFPVPAANGADGPHRTTLATLSAVV
jgi:hypothetical protein